MTSIDDNPRPPKRVRLSPPCSSSSSTMERKMIQGTPPPPTTRIPSPILLLSLPTLLQHPPGHKNHRRGLLLSQFALQRCLKEAGLDVASECRAWTELAELGFRVGLDEPGVEGEVEKAITKATLIASKHPTLITYQPRIMRLSAKLALHQGNPKLASTSLKRSITSYNTATTPPHEVYASHIAYITSLSIGASQSPSSTSFTSTTFGNSSSNGASDASLKPLSAIRDLYTLASRNKHEDVARLAVVLELKELMHHGLWTRFASALKRAEEVLGLEFLIQDEGVEEENGKARDKGKGNGHKECNKDGANDLKRKRETPVREEGGPTTDIDKVIHIHVLMFGLIFYTYLGDGEACQPRMKKLHDLLDSGALGAFGDWGVVDIHIPNSSSPLQIQLTHPRVILNLAFLISAISKRDPVGRKPKRKLFASEGVAALERDLKRAIELPIWGSQYDLDNIYLRIHKIKADMICELIGVAICRSEFSEAEKRLAELIAFTRSQSLFSAYSARITLHHAHLAHALGNTERAVKCYRVAAHLSRPRTATVVQKKTHTQVRFQDSRQKDSSYASSSSQDQHQTQQGPLEQAEEEEDEEGTPDAFVHASSLAGELWLRIGCLCDIPDPALRAAEFETLRKRSVGVVQMTEGLGGTLRAVGSVIRACVSGEFLEAKSHLRTALNLCTAAQDNHLRPLILSLIAGQYMHTSPEHTEKMLATADQLAAGLGAQPKGNGSSSSSMVIPEGKGKDKATTGTDPHTPIKQKPNKGDDEMLTPTQTPVSSKPSTTTTTTSTTPRPSTSTSNTSTSTTTTTTTPKPKDLSDGIGNAYLRLWIGERNLELKKRAGDEEAVRKQGWVNEKLRGAVERVRRKAGRVGAGGAGAGGAGAGAGAGGRESLSGGGGVGVGRGDGEGDGGEVTPKKR